MVSKNRTKYIRSLKSKKFRQQYRQFIAEGEKNLLEVLQSQYKIDSLYLTNEFFECYKHLFSDIHVEQVSENWLASTGSFSTNKSGLAVLNMPEYKKFFHQKGEWTVLLDDIRDPGNLGTIIRTCDWFGIKNVICSPDTVELYNPKVINATMGSFTRIKVFSENPGQVLGEHSQVPAFAAVIGGEPVSKQKFQEPGFLLIGNESSGISQELLDYNVTKISIPGRGGAESLNASVATGIILDRMIN